VLTDGNWISAARDSFNRLNPKYAGRVQWISPRDELLQVRHPVPSESATALALVGPPNYSSSHQSGRPFEFESSVAETAGTLPSRGVTAPDHATSLPNCPPTPRSARVTTDDMPGDRPALARNLSNHQRPAAAGQRIHPDKPPHALDLPKWRT
jgi:hypothetical protein